MSQSVYKVMGKNGRIYLPRELQSEMEIQRGDIIKLIPVKDGVRDQEGSPHRNGG